MQIELTGMSVRAVESLTKSVRMHRNPKYFGANAPLFLPHQILVGGPVVYVQGLFPKTTRALLSMFSNSPTVISVTVFCLGQLFDHNTLIRLYCPTRFIRGDMMRKLIYVLFIFIPFCTHARTLHVGDNAIKLSEFKTTTPALHVRVGDEIWYGNMCTNFNTDSLHIKYNDTVYDVIAPFVDTTNYTYDTDGRLIGANENIYLENIDKAWIDTGILPSLNLLTHISVYALNYTGNVIYGTGGPKDAPVIDVETYRLFNFNGKIYFDINGVANRLIGESLSFDKNIKYNFELGNRYVKDLNSGYIIESTPLKTLTFIPNDSHKLRLFDRYIGIIRIFYTKIWDNDTLVRHFVPVPCGLQIGDFIVPSNGMWDIVEQKFYGNMGSGDFIYGVDE